MSYFLYLLKFSFRNLFRVPKRTLIMVMSLSLGTGFIIWDLNFANSGSKEVMKDFLAQYSGQYHVTHKNYYGEKNKKLFDNYKTMTDAQISDPKVLSKSTKRVTAPVFISGEKKTLGVLLTGIEVDQEITLSSLHKAVTVGRHLIGVNSKEIIIGKKLADRISVNIGSEVAIIGQALDGSVANDLYVVVGLIDFGGGDLEESLAFTQFKSLQEFLSLSPEQYHQRVSFDLDADKLPPMSGLAVTHWAELLPEIGVSVKFIDNFTWVVSVIIVVVLSLGLSNTLMITFFEREQEFQSLNIIGAQTKWITATLMIEVFIMGTIAIMIGVVIGAFATWLNSIYPIDIEIFTGGKPLLMGGIAIKPLVKLYPVAQYFWQVPLMIYFFLTLTMIYPLIRVIRRSSHAI